MSVFAEALAQAREKQADAKAYSVYGHDGKWHVDDDTWVELHSAIDAALDLIEQRATYMETALWEIVELYEIGPAAHIARAALSAREEAQ